MDLNRTPSRYDRQADLVPQQRLAELKTTVIGVGAIGRQVAIQLTAIGVRNLQIVDFDTVDLSNVTTQGYPNSKIGLLKVAALSEDLQMIDPSIRLEQVPERWQPHLRPGEAVFCGVDSISARTAIWKNVNVRCQFWCDGRMLGEVVRILTVSEDAGRRRYPTTHFDQSEAQAGRCTSRSTIYTANIAAGLMVHQFTRWLRQVSIEPDLSLNLLASELFTAS